MPNPLHESISNAGAVLNDVLARSSPTDLASTIRLKRKAFGGESLLTKDPMVNKLSIVAHSSLIRCHQAVNL